MFKNEYPTDPFSDGSDDFEDMEDVCETEYDIFEFEDEGGFEEQPLEMNFKIKPIVSLEQMLSELESMSQISNSASLTVKERIKNIDKFVLQNNQLAGEKNLIHISVMNQNPDLFLFLINEIGYTPFDLNNKDKNNADAFNVYFHYPDFLDILWEQTSYFNEKSVQLSFHHAICKYIFDNRKKSLFDSNEKIINFINNKFTPVFSENLKKEKIKIEESSRKTIDEVFENNLIFKNDSMISHYNRYMKSAFNFSEKAILLAGLQKMRNPDHLKLFMNICSDMKVNKNSDMFKNFMFRFLCLCLKGKNNISSYCVSCPEEINKILLHKDKEGDNIFHHIARNMNENNTSNESNLLTLLVSYKETRYLLNEKNEEGETPCENMVKKGKESLVPLLLLHDADLNSVIPLLKNSVYIEMIMENEKNRLDNSINPFINQQKQPIKRI